MITIRHYKFHLVDTYDTVCNKYISRLYHPEDGNFFSVSPKEIELLETEARKHYPLELQAGPYTYFTTSLQSVRSFMHFYDHDGENVVLFNGLDFTALLNTSADEMLFNIGIRDTLCIVTRKETLSFSYLSRMCRLSQIYHGTVSTKLRSKFQESFSDHVLYSVLRQQDFTKSVFLDGVERHALKEMRLDEWIYTIENSYFVVYHVDNYIVPGETLISDLPSNCKISTK